MKICPKYGPGHALGRLKHVVMVVPVDSDVGEAQNVTQEYWKQGTEGLEGITMWHSELKHHDGDNDRKNAVAKRFKSALTHL